MHRKVTHSIFSFFLPYLQDHGLLRSRNFAASVDSYFKRCRILLRVVYYLQNISGKSGWKVNATRLFGHSSLLPPESKIVLDAFVAVIRTTRFFPGEHIPGPPSILTLMGVD